MRELSIKEAEQVSGGWIGIAIRVVIAVAALCAAGDAN